MSYLVLARKYRPQTFDEVISQKHVTQTLTNAILSGRVAHAILFAGPRGTGKTTMARILAKAMNCKIGPTPIPCNQCTSCNEITNCNSVDVFEIDGASNNGVEHIRELRENIKYMPASSTFKIYIIDEVHMLSTAAFNALLKTLEEPPAHILFIFATTEPHKVPITILSRCQRYDFKRIGVESTIRHMEAICKKENVFISIDSLGIIAREAGGCVRDALSLLDHVISSSEADISYEHVLNILGILDRKQIFRISDLVLNGKVSEIIDLIDELYNKGYDLKKIYTDLVEHFRNLLVAKIGKRIDKLVDVPVYETDEILKQTKDVSVETLSQLLDILFNAEASIKLTLLPKIAFEMVFVRMSQIKPTLSIDVLIEKLDHLKKELSLNQLPQITLNPDCNQNQDCKVIAEKEINIPVFQKADNDINSIWEKISKIIEDKYPAMGAYLNKSSLKRLSENEIEIEVSSNTFNINMLRREKNLDNLKEVCSDFLGRKINVVINANLQDDLETQKKNHEEFLRKEALDHPIIADVLEIFNGRIIDVKILPN